MSSSNGAAAGSDPITWRLHLASPPDAVYAMLDTAAGRERFWAEEAGERGGVVEFVFINGMRSAGRILERVPPARWSVDYFDTTATFHLEPDGSGGTDLTLVNHGVPPADRIEVTAGWLNVLLPLKAAVDHGIDLRSHDPSRTWDQGYVDQ